MKPYIPPHEAPHGTSRMLIDNDLSQITWVGNNGTRQHLSGPLSDMTPRHGVKLRTIKGVGGPFKHIDQQGARQDGTDWLAAFYDPAEIDLGLSFDGETNTARRRVFREWMSGWSPYRQGRLSWFTADLGEWWMMLRLLNAPTGDVPGGHLSSWQMDWSARADLPFWQSFPSTSSVIAASPTRLIDPSKQNADNFLPLSNRGDVNGWPEYLLQGPGLFTLNDNGIVSSPRKISIQVNSREVVLLKTLPRFRSATEVNTNADVYPRLKSRFSQPIPPSTPVQVSITVSGAVAGQTAAKATLTPLRTWPE